MASPTQICVVGAGAIGGLMAARLALAGASVSVVARGAHLEAIRRNGLKLVEQDGSERVAAPRATDRIADLGPHDIVILAMKAHQLAPVASELTSLTGPETVFVTAQNGLPWWYFFKHGGPHEGRHLESVDPAGAIASRIDAGRVIGCIVYPAAEIAAPGVIRHMEGNRFPVGEIDGADTPRVRRVAQLLREAGFRAPVLSKIRTEIWVKLWGNCTFNPISALTHATLSDICRFPLSRRLAADMMAEAQAVAGRLGIEFPVSLDQRIAGAEAVGEHKTSMLQDVESGRPIELEALLGSVIELGRITQTPTPRLEAVYACAALLARSLSARNGRLRIEPAGGR
ncbi:MAG TPA: 2-dehydropantoate 2-reductase [Burkholderiaceae bacterium]